MSSKNSKKGKVTEKHLKINAQAKYQHLIWPVFIVIASLIAFLPAFQNGFTNFDDPVYVIENPYVYELSWTNLVNIFSDFYYGGYYPLTILSFALDYAIGGMNPFMYHFTNILLHLLNTLLIYLIIRKITSSLIIAVITSLLFGIHTMHVESVVWISERKDVLYAFFFFLSILSYLTYIHKKQRNFYILSLFLFLFSILAKSMAVSLFLCLLLIDWYSRRKLNSRDVIVEKIPFLVLSLVFGVIAIFSQSSIGAVHSETTFPIFQRFVFACYGFCIYLFKLIIPYGLTAIYPFPIQTGESLPFIYYLFILPIPVFIYLIIRFYQKFRNYIFAFLFFVFNIILVLQIIQINDFITADRFVYVASAGIFLFLAFLFKEFFDKFPQSKNTLITVLSAYSLFLIIYTNQYTRVWKDSISLWDHVLEKHPDIYRALDKRGQARSDIGEFKMAILDFDKALSINPEHYNAYINRGYARNMLGDAQSALDDYNKAISLDPDYYMAYNNRGTTFANLGKIDEAISDFNKSLELNPENTKAYTNRGLARMSLEQTDLAMEDFNKSIKLNPDYYPAYNFRGLLLAKQNKLSEALKDLDHCLKLYPDFPDALYNRGIIRLQSNQKQSGCQDLYRAANLGYERAYTMIKIYCN